ncbi:hypothetical protein [Streptomyces sp. 8N616]|uniref:hypothetical protein n=1 Tax=Streptomyces sp. 8N616 TaxID=3457414 RepID=UPI003FD43AED
MSRARRTNKRRFLGVGLAGAALITGAVATGAAMAGEDGEAGACSSLDPKSSEVAAKAQQGGVVDPAQLDGQLAGLMALVGAEPDSLQNLDDALRALPSDKAAVGIEDIELGGDEAPKVTLKSLDGKTPEAWAKANPNVDLQPFNSQLASAGEGLAALLGGSGGLENLQAAFGQIAVNNAIDIEDVDIEDVELELKKAESGKVQVKAKSLTNCEE